MEPEYFQWTKYDSKQVFLNQNSFLEVVDFFF